MKGGTRVQGDWMKGGHKGIKKWDGRESLGGGKGVGKKEPLSSTSQGQKSINVYFFLLKLINPFHLPFSFS